MFPSRLHRLNACARARARLFLLRFSVVQRPPTAVGTSCAGGLRALSLTPSSPRRYSSSSTPHVSSHVPHVKFFFSLIVKAFFVCFVMCVAQTPGIHLLSRPRRTIQVSLPSTGCPVPTILDAMSGLKRSPRKGRVRQPHHLWNPPR